MAQVQQPKTPLEILQIQINAVLIETGKALRATGLEGGKTMAISAIRLHSTIPSITDNFHRALDDLEAQIVRAKSALGRDLEALRSKRIATENPPIQLINEPDASQPASPPHTKFDDQAVAMEEERVREVTPLQTISTEEENLVKNDPSKEIVCEEERKEAMVLSPPSTNDNKSQAVHLGRNTTLSASVGAPAPATVGRQDSSIDSLFDIPENAAKEDSAPVNFDNMGFTMLDATTNTQSLDNNQTQNTELDLSTFGSNPQDFNINDLQPSHETSSNNAKTSTTNGKGNMVDDLLDMTGGSRANNNSNNINNNNNGMDLDLDLDDMVGAEESVFDDLFFGGDDDANVGGELSEMEHGQFDNAFFGID
ncbi:38532dd9-3cb6-4ad9-a9b1-a67990361160 [Sclerotinia trifoliorum]|uniref:38532dd9-3cb6-4ad9-a9b1-a67990361160 n=1 Tax=Sclerotinia trifoliorum TaxID=28548 RepID=A0A8H2VSW9_9HELO|nr:38532dd9-3cb6-4ad9-a9b1-a67990361160 [Sclerotinia trifoliorum]